MMAVTGKQWVAATRGLSPASKPSSRRLAQQALQMGACKQWLACRQAGRRMTRHQFASMVMH